MNKWERGACFFLFGVGYEYSLVGTGWGLVSLLCLCEKPNGRKRKCITRIAAHNVLHTTHETCLFPCDHDTLTSDVSGYVDADETVGNYTAHWSYGGDVGYRVSHPPFDVEEKKLRGEIDAGWWELVKQRRKGSRMPVYAE